MPRNTNPEPKPFVLIDIPPECPNRISVVTHEKFSGLTGQLKLIFTVVSEYLFVGSGSYECDPKHGNRRPDVWYTFYRLNGRICVPGTSIKGAIRAITEAISNSCVSHKRPNENISSKSHNHCKYDSKKSVSDNRLCPACRLFGTTGYRGRVYFTDFFPDREITTEIVKIGELWEPKRFIPSKRRFYKHSIFKPIKDTFPEKNFRFVEAVWKEAKFNGSLIFENVTEAELGLIFHALGWELSEEGVKQSFYPKLGGAKPRCFGAVKFTPVSLQLRSEGINGLLNPQELKEKNLLKWLYDCLQACQKEKLLHMPSWKVLVNSFRKENKSCPKEMY